MKPRAKNARLRAVMESAETRTLREAVAVLTQFGEVARLAEMRTSELRRVVRERFVIGNGPGDNAERLSDLRRECAASLRDVGHPWNLGNRAA